jgi:hypothetical protein
MVTQDANENSPLSHVCHQSCYETQNLVFNFKNKITFASVSGVSGLTTFLAHAPIMQSPRWNSITIRIYMDKDRTLHPPTYPRTLSPTSVCVK